MLPCDVAVAVAVATVDDSSSKGDHSDFKQPISLISKGKLRLCVASLNLPSSKILRLKGHLGGSWQEHGLDSIIKGLNGVSNFWNDHPMVARHLTLTVGQKKAGIPKKGFHLWPMFFEFFRGSHFTVSCNKFQNCLEMSWRFHIKNLARTGIVHVLNNCRSQSRLIDQHRNEDRDRGANHLFTAVGRTAVNGAQMDPSSRELIHRY